MSKQDPGHQHAVDVATATAERLAELADVAELMGDAPGADRLRRRAAAARERAMTLLDE